MPALLYLYAERAATSTRRCTVNPLIGRELEGDEIGKAPVPRKVWWWEAAPAD